MGSELRLQLVFVRAGAREAYRGAQRLQPRIPVDVRRHLGQQLFRVVDTPFLDEPFRAVHDLDEGRGQGPLDEGAHLRFRQGAEEMRQWLAVAEREHRGDRAHLQGLGELLVFVDVHRDELEAAGVFALQLFQHRGERAARRAPRRPEVHQHGQLRRRLDHRLLEIAYAHVHGMAKLGAQGAIINSFPQAASR